LYLERFELGRGSGKRKFSRGGSTETARCQKISSAKFCSILSPSAILILYITKQKQHIFSVLFFCLFYIFFNFSSLNAIFLIFIYTRYHRINNPRHKEKKHKIENTHCGKRWESIFSEISENA